MCNLGESILKEGMKQGKIKSAIEHTKNVMKNCNVDMNKAMDMLKLPENIKEVVIKELNESL